jgi:hypothetical protein
MKRLQECWVLTTCDYVNPPSIQGVVFTIEEARQYIKDTPRKDGYYGSVHPGYERTWTVTL